MNVKVIKQSWETNFRNSSAVKYGKYNQSAICNVFWNSNPCIPGRFKKGFRYFHDHYYYLDPTRDLDLLLDYLSYIGIIVRKEAILDALKTKGLTFPKILEKCFFLFRSLAMHHGRFDVKEPFRKSLDSIEFLLEIEAGIYGTRDSINFLEKKVEI